MTPRRWLLLLVRLLLWLWLGLDLRADRVVGCFRVSLGSRNAQAGRQRSSALGDGSRVSLQLHPDSSQVGIIAEAGMSLVKIGDCILQVLQHRSGNLFLHRGAPEFRTRAETWPVSRPLAIRLFHPAWLTQQQLGAAAFATLSQASDLPPRRLG